MSNNVDEIYSRKNSLCCNDNTNENVLLKERKKSAEISKNREQTLAFEKSILPNININGKIPSAKNVSFVENCDRSSIQDCKVKLPYIGEQRKKQLLKQIMNDDQTKNDTNEKPVVNIDSCVEKYDFISQKRNLEESLKESLKFYNQPKCYLDGETKSTHHLMLEMNEFYLDMAEQLRFLKGNLLNSARRRVEETDDEDTGVSGYETELCKLIASIEEGDQKVAENVKKLKEFKEERCVIHQEIKSLYENSKSSKKNEETFGITYLGDVKENNVNEETINLENGNIAETHTKDINGKKKKDVRDDGKDFIAKNKELAKEYNNMTRYCLTDEEKRKLQSLLSDIDVCEERSTDECIRDVEEHEKEIRKMRNDQTVETYNQTADQDHEDDQAYSNLIYVNGFKFETEENEILSELHLKLINLREGKEIELVDKDDHLNEIEEAENQGKHWKFQVLQKRLKHIEKTLDAIQLEREKEDEEFEKLIQERVDNRADIEEEYKRSIDDISVDIGELEYETMKESEVENNLQ